MTTRWRAELPHLFLLAGMWALAAWAWPRSPDRLPVHWDASGHVNGWGGRFEGIVLMPLVATGLYFLLRFLPRLDPGRANYANFTGAYALIRLALTVTLALVFVAMQAELRGWPFRVAQAVPLAVGALFVVLGGAMGKIRPNWFVGIRTPWTLSSKQSWVRTHRVGGWLFVLDGLVIAVAGLAFPAQAEVAILAAVLGSTAFLFVYSYVVWRDDADKVPPAGSLPADETPAR